VAIIILSLVLAMMAVGIGGCGTVNPTETTSSYIETRFVVSGDKVYRLDIFISEGSTIEGYWKADSALFFWYTTPTGRALPRQDYGTGPHGERVIDVREPGTLYGDEPALRIADANGSYIYDDPMDGCGGGEFKIRATQKGYYSLCFMAYSGESVGVTLQYEVMD